ncbi:hypothetical protein QQP08_016644 [Theobroma cacao]|nr:hypothetical protein QQP08_016644 [Theobroma cacao]
MTTDADCTKCERLQFSRKTPGQGQNQNICIVKQLPIKVPKDRPEPNMQYYTFNQLKCSFWSIPTTEAPQAEQVLPQLLHLEMRQSPALKKSKKEMENNTLI